MFRGDEKNLPRTWCKIKVRKGGKDVDTIAIICPGCSQSLCLPKHKIDYVRGTVQPSVVCTHPGCSYHECLAEVQSVECSSNHSHRHALVKKREERPWLTLMSWGEESR
jgi:hypothetical protein